MITNASRAKYAMVLILVATATAEVTARLEDYLREGVPVTAAPSWNRDLTITDSLGIRGRPYGKFKKWVLNSAGFRSPELRHDRAPECRRIMLLGASETFGYYESQGKEYAAQLADSLRPRGCHEIQNAAIAGFSLPYITALWNSWGMKFAPDLVLIYVTPSFYLADKAPAYPMAGKTRSRNNDSPWWMPRLAGRAKDVVELPAVIQRWRLKRWIAQGVKDKPEAWLFRDAPAARLSQFAQDLDSLTKAIQGTGATPVLITHAIRFAEPLTPGDSDHLLAWRNATPRATETTLLSFEGAAADSTRALALRRSLPLVDARAAFWGRRELFADFAHFNDQGAGVMAGVIARVLQPILDSMPSRRTASSRENPEAGR